MRIARIAVLAVAIGAGLIAWTMARNIGGETDAPVVVEQAIETDQVLVAARDIAPGKRLSEADLTWETWPTAAVNQSFIRQAARPDAVDDLSGAVARGAIFAGEPLRENKLARAGQGGYLAAVLPSGMRAVSTRTSPQTGAGGFILPNDRVDVILTQRENGRGREGFVSERVLENIRVLAIDQTVEEQDGRNVVVGNVATLELRPDQVEHLALAEQLGDISLALRSIMDGGETEANGIIPRQSTVNVVRFGVPSRVRAGDGGWEGVPTQ